MMRIFKLWIVAAVAFCVSVNAAAAGKARQHWTKIEVSNVGHDRVDLPHGLLKAFGAEVVSDYGTFVILQVPENAADALKNALQRQDLAVRGRDELDVLQFPEAQLDTRAGIVDVSQDGLIPVYPSGKTGLFVIQLTAPARQEWIAELEGIGWQLARYIPNNGYLAIGKAPLMAGTRQLSYVQWVDVHHPYQKFMRVPRNGAVKKVIVELSAGPVLDEAISAVERISGNTVKVVPGRMSTRAFTSMTAAAADRLLRESLILGVAVDSPLQLSDERQAMSLTEHVNPSATGVKLPKPSQTYWGWVTSKCIACGSGTTSDADWRDIWRIGFADTGLDTGDGYSGTSHLDFTGRKFWGLYPSLGSSADRGCGAGGYGGGCDRGNGGYHGTMVASVAAGKPPSGAPADSDGYFFGQGVAPYAGIYMTDVGFGLGDDYDDPAQGNQDDLRSWFADAYTPTQDVVVQNHSFNEYNVTDDGLYTLMAQDYDVAVRDADLTASGQQSLFITVSAGNNNNPGMTGANKYYVSAGGTAKNVVSVGGVESDRNAATCNSSESDSFRNIMAATKLGTRLTDYIKPDVVAPASATAAALSVAYASVPVICDVGQSTTDPRNETYLALGGTSFAAPVAAGMGIIVKRSLGSTPGATSPALTKAMLIAGARSIAGGEDRTQTPAGTVTAVPSTQQGFGRLSFIDILGTSPLPYDQNSARIFTSSGQRLIARFRVRDSAKPVKAVLVWTDVPASAFATNPLVNNLDLQVLPVSSPNDVYLGNRLDTTTEYSIAYPRNGTLSPDSVNNVEIARFTLATNGEFDLAVLAASVTQNIDGGSGAKQDFALVVLNADEISAFTVAAPTNVVATSYSTGSATVTWTAVTNADGYRVERKVDGGAWALATNITGNSTTSYTDSSLSAPYGVVLYRVFAKLESTTSAPSNNDVAFVEAVEAIAPNTPLLASHMTQLRRAVNGLLVIGGGSEYFSANDVNTSLVQTQAVDVAHITAVMSKLNDARADLDVALGAVSFRTPPPDPPALGGTIEDTHIIDVRAGIQ